MEESLKNKRSGGFALILYEHVQSTHTPPLAMQNLPFIPSTHSSCGVMWLQCLKSDKSVGWIALYNDEQAIPISTPSPYERGQSFKTSIHTTTSEIKDNSPFDWLNKHLAALENLPGGGNEEKSFLLGEYFSNPVSIVSFWHPR